MVARTRLNVTLYVHCGRRYVLHYILRLSLTLTVTLSVSLQ